MRQPDRYNPRGHFELEAVKQLGGGRQPVAGAGQGEGRKVRCPSDSKTPGDRCCEVIFTNRQFQEVILSQNRMLAGRGRPCDPEHDVAVAKSRLREERSFD